MKLSMIVVMTSCAPVFALRMPGMKPQKAPPRKPATITTIDSGDREERQPDPRRRRSESTDVHLTLGPDVEQARPEAESDRQSDEDERRRRHDRPEMGYSAAWIWSRLADTIALPISVGSPNAPMNRARYDSLHDLP